MQVSFNGMRQRIGKSDSWQGGEFGQENGRQTRFMIDTACRFPYFSPTVCKTIDSKTEKIGKR